MGFTENADLYPNLEWRTAGDSDVRAEHAKLDGLILPVNDDFWRSHTPPLGFGCRCELTQTDKPAKRNEGYKDTTAPKGFDFNPGIDQKLFSDSAGYYRNAQKNTVDSLKKSAVEFSGLASKTATVNEYPITGKNFKMSQIKGHDEIKVYKGNIRDITYKYHDNKTLRNLLIYDLKNVLKNAKLIDNAPESKGRAKYNWWYYLKVDGFDNMFLNVAKMKSGELKLHAITHELKK